MPRRRLGHELREAAVPQLGEVSFRRLRGVPELPFEVDTPQFDAHAELLKYPPLAFVDPGVIGRVPGVINDDPTLGAGVIGGRCPRLATTPDLDPRAEPVSRAAALDHIQIAALEFNCSPSTLAIRLRSARMHCETAF